MRTRFILIETSHAGNVGAAARAMKVMGFDDLVLVAPRKPEVLGSDEARQRASGAADVLERARVVQDLDAALDGVSHVCATAMTARDFGPPTRSPREHLASLVSASGGGGVGQGAQQGVAFLFGPERFGLSNEHVYRSHVCLRIPTAPSYGSLNLAAAVQLLAYEWRSALGGFEGPEDEAAGTRIADARAVSGLLAHWREALVEIGYLDPAVPRKLMPRLQRLLNRAMPTDEEVHILRGVARAVLQSIHKAGR